MGADYEKDVTGVCRNPAHDTSVPRRRVTHTAKELDWPISSANAHNHLMYHYTLWPFLTVTSPPNLMYCIHHSGIKLAYFFIDQPVKCQDNLKSSTVNQKLLLELSLIRK